MNNLLSVYKQLSLAVFDAYESPESVTQTPIAFVHGYVMGAMFSGRLQHILGSEPISEMAFSVTWAYLDFIEAICKEVTYDVGQAEDFSFGFTLAYRDVNKHYSQFYKVLTDQYRVPSTKVVIPSRVLSVVRKYSNMFVN